MWLRLVLVAVLFVAIIGVSAVIWGGIRWHRETEDLRERLDAGREPVGTDRYTLHALDCLPPPVARYLRLALTDRQPLVIAAHLRHEGQFNASEGTPQWVPFSSTQDVVIRRPGFDWDARIRMAPGMTTFVHDAYVGGEGRLHAAVGGLVTVAASQDTPEVAEGELTRFLAEAAWYPTVLLPGQGVTWTAIDDTSARATLVDGPTTAALTFTFDAEGLVTTVYADARWRLADGKLSRMPWSGRFSRYERRHGMLIPTEGEVAWVTERGPEPYWRGRLVDAKYEFAGGD